MAVASYVAAALNIAVAGVSLAIRRDVDAAPEPSSPAAAVAMRGVYFAIGMSGLCALGAEVVWTRILSLMLGPTTYTFSIILGVFLAGLGLGSWGGAKLAELKSNPRLWLALSQFLLCLCVAWAAFALAGWLPYWKGNVDSLRGPWKDFQGDVLRTMLAVLPGAVLWGASFPLALASVATQEGADPARVVGGIYGANTIGAILGSILFALLVIPAEGTLGAQQLLIVLSGAGGAVALYGAMPKVTAKLAGGFAIALIVAWLIPPVPWMLIGFGRRLPSTTGRWDLLEELEGINSSAAWSR
jgi:spermidine synthase